MIFTRNFTRAKWYIEGGQIKCWNVRPNFKFYIIDPQIINGYGKNKDSVLTAEELESLSHVSGDDTLEFDASPFTPESWGSYGWDAPGETAETLFDQIENFVVVNTIPYKPYAIVVVDKIISGNRYSFGLFYPGSHGESYIIGGSDFDITGDYWFNGNTSLDLFVSGDWPNE